MEYICPNTQCNTKWNWTESFYYGGTPFHCEKCSQNTTVPLYCPHCYPANVPKKGYLQTPTGFLGGETYTCGRCRKPFTVVVMMGEIHDRLGGMGTDFGKYHQSERIETLPNQRLKSVVSGGYCAGVAYDWIRRILLSGKTSYDEGKLRTDTRVAYAWTQQTSEKKNTYINQKLTALNNANSQFAQRQFADANREISELTDKVNEAYRRIAQSGLTPQQLQIAEARIEQRYNERIVEIRAGRDSRVQEQDVKVEAWTSKGTTQQYWGEFARIMDEYLAKDRSSRGKEGPSSRGFSDLTVTKALDTKLYNGLGAFFDTLLRDPDLKTHRAVYIAVTPPTEGATGHAIALYRQGTGRFYLFDPNIGTYELTEAKTREAMIYIFQKAYPNMPSGDTSDNHAYEIGGRVKGGYTIFQTDRPAVPIVNSLVTTQPKAPITPPVLEPLNTPPPFQPITVNRPIVPPTGLRNVGTNVTPNTGTPNTGTPNTGTPNTGTPPRTGGVSDLIRRFNK